MRPGVLVLSMTAGAAGAGDAGDIVTHTVIIQNSGNVALRDVTITTALERGSPPAAVTGLTSYTCTRTGSAVAISSTIPVASGLVCTASYTFATVEDIEAGNLTFATTVSAAGKTGPLVWSVVPAVHHVAVISAPRVDLALNSTTCDAPDTAGKLQHGC